MLDEVLLESFPDHVSNLLLRLIPRRLLSLELALIHLLQVFKHFLFVGLVGGLGAAWREHLALAYGVVVHFGLRRLAWLF